MTDLDTLLALALPFGFALLGFVVGIVQQVPGGVPEFTPFIRYNAFGDSSITFSVILRGREVVDQYLIRHEFIKRLHERYRCEGIVIPFPMRTLDLTAEAAQLLAGMPADGDVPPARARALHRR